MAKLGLKVSQNVAPVAEDESVTGVGKQPEMTIRHCRGQRVGLRCRDRPVQLTLKDPHVGTDLVNSRAPRPTLECTIPALRVDSLFNRFPDGPDEHAPDGRISQKLYVRFGPGQVEKTLRSLHQPCNGLGDLLRCSSKILPGKSGQLLVIISLLR